MHGTAALHNVQRHVAGPPSLINGHCQNGTLTHTHKKHPHFHISISRAITDCHTAARTPLRERPSLQTAWLQIVRCIFWTQCRIGGGQEHMGGACAA